MTPFCQTELLTDCEPISDMVLSFIILFFGKSICLVLVLPPFIDYLRPGHYDPPVPPRSRPLGGWCTPQVREGCRGNIWTPSSSLLLSNSQADTRVRWPFPSPRCHGLPRGVLMYCWDTYLDTLAHSNWFRL